MIIKMYCEKKIHKWYNFCYNINQVSKPKIKEIVHKQTGFFNWKDFIRFKWFVIL